MLARQVDLGRDRGHAVAEPAVDRVFGRPQHRERIRRARVPRRAAIASCPADKPRRRCVEHAHDGDPGGLHLPARHGEVERECGRAGDHGVAIEARDHAVRPSTGQALDRVCGRRGKSRTEIVLDRPEGRAHLLRVGTGPHSMAPDPSAVGIVPVEVARLAVERPRLERAVVDAGDRHHLGVVAGGEDLVRVWKSG